MRITRSPVADVKGVHASSFAELTALLTGAGVLEDHGAWVAADLSLGAWSSELFADQILAQLHGTLPTARPDQMSTGPDTKRSDVLKGAEMIGRLVDGEAAGKTGVVRMLRRAEETVLLLGNLSPRLVLVLAPRFGRRWRSADVAYLKFLADGLRHAGTRLVVVASDGVSPLPPVFAVTWLNAAPPRREPSTPSGALAALIPDVLTPDVADELRALGDADVPTLTLSGGRRLIDPSVRSKPSADLRPLHDRLSTLSSIDSSIRAYAHVHGTGYHCDVGLLVGEAWRQFARGGHEISIELMEHVCVAVRDPSARSRLLYELQGMRIALQRFDEALDVPDFPPTVSDAIRGGLLMTKGWARVMTGRPLEARRQLESARHLLAPVIGQGRQFLYLENIYALSLLRSGDPAASLAREQEIEASLDERSKSSGSDDWQLTYVNSINQARLFKYRRDYDQSLRYYERAFATTLGDRSESDALYAAVCLAQLHAARGEPAMAHSCWLRAGLHWAAADVPEALAPRAASGVLGVRVVETDDVVDDVAEALYREISGAAAALGLELNKVDTPPGFGRTDRLDASIDFDRLVGDDGWAVLTSVDHVTSALSGPVHERLRGLLTGEICRARATGDGSIGAVVLPIMSSTDVPTSWHGAVEACAWHRVADLDYAGRHRRFRDRELLDLAASLEIAHGYAIDAVDAGDPTAVGVSFRRFRSPVTLTGLDALVMLGSTEPTTVRALAMSVADADRPWVASTVERLVAERILRRQLPGDRRRTRH